MMEKRIIQLLFCLGIVRGATRRYCPYNQILCGNGADCIQVKNICDYSPDCSDSSDEYNLKLCKVFVKQRKRCSNSKVSCTRKNSDHDCMDIQPACAKNNCLEGEDKLICEEVGKGQLTPVNQTEEVISDKFKQKIDFMHSMMKSSLEKNFTVCPFFYKEHKGLCYSMFAPLEVKWVEAKLFCKSIAGQLAIIQNVTDFKNVLDLLRDHNLQKSLWIGGSSLMNESEWRWVNGEQVQMGAPFWSLDYTLERTNEKGICKDDTENTDVQMEIRPRKKDRNSMCIAMMKENFHYFSDEFCSRSFAPLCTTEPV